MLFVEALGLQNPSCRSYKKIPGKGSSLEGGTSRLESRRKLQFLFKLELEFVVDNVAIIVVGFVVPDPLEFGKHAIYSKRCFGL